MQSRIKRTFIAIVASVLGFGQAAAAELTVVGTGDGIDVLRAIATSYAAAHPGDKVDIPPSIGSGGGIAAVANGTNILARVARPLKDSETAAGLIAVPVMRLPSAIFVHRGINVESLSTRQLVDIFAGKITNWREVGGPDVRVRVVRREDSDSTLTALRELMPSWRDLTLTERSKTATTTQEAVDSVRDVEGAIGFGPYSTSLDQVVRVLKIDGKHPIEDGYPSAVTLTLVSKRGASTPLAEAFAAFARSNEAKDVMRRMGAVPAKD